MFIHMATTARRRADPPDAQARVDRRDRLLDAARTVFARTGFFSAQVADVAREAGMAAGTVYLYFRSKDDLLISLFERTMREALADGRAVLASDADPIGRLHRLAELHLGRLGRDRDLAVVFQIELRQSTKFMTRLSASLLGDYLDIIRDVIRDGQARKVLRSDMSPSMAAKIVFGALDEMATNWVLSDRHYALEADAGIVVDLLVQGLAAPARRRASAHGHRRGAR
jgi:TetR/AcrR family transcriptional regulator, fatty acid metabolism regulator protein